MKTEEDEAFDDIARRQGAWGGGFPAKRAMAADKLQEPVNLLEARRIAAEYGIPDSQIDSGNLYFALMKCLEHIDAQPAQEPVAHVYLFDHDGRPLIAWDNAKGIKIGDKLYTAPPQREWVGLTDERLDEIHASLFQGPFDPEDILNMRVAARAVEAAHNIGAKP